MKQGIAVVALWPLLFVTAAQAQQSFTPPLQCDDSSLVARYQALQRQEKTILDSLASVDVPSDEQEKLSADADKQIAEARQKLGDIKREQMEIYSGCDRSQSKANARAEEKRGEALKKVRANARNAKPANAVAPVQ